MTDIYDANGAFIARIPVSDKQMEDMKRGGEATINYRAPRSMQERIVTAGSFTLSMDAQDRVVASSVDEVKNYASHVDAIKRQR